MSAETFDAAWLAMREPVDHRSRARAPVVSLRMEGCRRGWSRLLDLGSGTGSNVRFLSARIPWASDWTLVDHDERLLSRAEAPSRGAELRTLVGDLAETGLEAVEGADVVTASALLDLVGDDWIRALVERCTASGAAACFALSYDGTVEWEGVDPFDTLVHEAVNRHQRMDKGLGSALGPAAATTAAERFEGVGYRVRIDESPWVLSSRDGALGARLVAGWADAAIEVAPEGSSEIRAWAERRIRDLAEDRTRVRVGHLDVLALPPE